MDLLSDGTQGISHCTLLSVSTGSTLVIEKLDNGIHLSSAHDILSNGQYAEERGLNYCAFYP